MEEPLRTLLEAMEAGAAIYGRALNQELLRLSEMSSEDLERLLAAVASDIEELRRCAGAAAETHERAQVIGTTLERSVGRVRAKSTVATSTDSPDPAHQEGTRRAILSVLAQAPGHRWTPQVVHDELRRQGRASGIGRAAVQSALRRLAADGQIERVGHGTYQLRGEQAAPDAPLAKPTLPPSPASFAAIMARARQTGEQGPPVVRPEILADVAETAASAFLANHPGEGDREHLKQIATESVLRWIERHGRAPDDVGHVRRLMKTALYDLHRRARDSRAGDRA